MRRVSGAAALLGAVTAQGVDTIFGLPGGQLDYFFDAIHEAGQRIRLIGTRHEQGAAYMAFGYARSTGRVGTYCVVPGPGVLNTAAALCTAYACNAPVLCLTGQTFSGREAFDMGLASKVVPDAEVLTTALEIARTIAAMPPLAVAQIKEVLLAGQDAPLETALMLERKAFQLLFDSKDQKEGMQAFLEKRKPIYQGK